MKKLFILLSVFHLAVGASWAQGPNGSNDYYQSADGLKGKALKEAMTKIIKNPSVESYDGLKEAYKKTDKRADNCVRDWYSNATKYSFGNMGGNSSEGAGWNREHLVPQSWFGSGDPKSDIVQVVPTDCWLNSQRGNKPLAEVTYGGNKNYSQSKNGYSKWGICKTPGYSKEVFEPNDNIKGDIARIYFYMAVCYADDAVKWGNAVFSTVRNQSFQKWYLDMLFRWSKLDPIDQVETARNNAVKTVQGNRNPFVDYPGLEDYIWGDKQDVAFSYAHYGQDTPGGDDNPGGEDNPGGGDDNPGGEDNPGGDDNPGGELPAEQAAEVCSIALNSEKFDSPWTGAWTSGKTELTTTQFGITVDYEKATGQNMYVSGSQIRIYTGNTLTVTSPDYDMTGIEFNVVKNEKQKTLSASSGTVTDYLWTGRERSVTFSVSSGSGHLQVDTLKISLDIPRVEPEDPENPLPSGDPDEQNPPTAITTAAASSVRPTIFDLQGRRQKSLDEKGVYIRDRRKIVVK